VRLVAEDGTAGLAEAWSEQAEIGAFFDQLCTVSAWLLGQDGEDIGAVHAALSSLTSRPEWAAPAVASAVDMALWDIRARHARQPLYDALGAPSGTVAVYASGGLYGTDKDLGALAAEMGGYAANGFTAIKMKIGGLALPDDLARVAAVRNVLGPDGAIMVDAVQQLTTDSAPGWVDALAALGVWAIQAPLPAHDLRGMAVLQARGPLTVVAQSERMGRPPSRRCWSSGQWECCSSVLGWPAGLPAASP
jgi:L-alanine-DL-glutamate epimerase-like enolase superfamily enzyme